MSVSIPTAKPPTRFVPKNPSFPNLGNITRHVRPRPMPPLSPYIPKPVRIPGWTKYLKGLKVGVGFAIPFIALKIWQRVVNGVPVVTYSYLLPDGNWERHPQLFPNGPNYNNMKGSFPFHYKYAKTWTSTRWASTTKDTAWNPDNFDFILGRWYFSLASRRNWFPGYYEFNIHDSYRSTNQWVSVTEPPPVSLTPDNTPGIAGTKPIPSPNFSPDPFTGAEPNPNVTPRPTYKPLKPPFWETQPGWNPSVNTNISINVTPTGTNVGTNGWTRPSGRPPNTTKEGKAKRNAAFAVLSALLDYTSEGAEIIDILFAHMQDQVMRDEYFRTQTRSDWFEAETFGERAEFVIDNIDLIQWDDLAYDLFLNEIEDQIIGRLNGLKPTMKPGTTLFGMQWPTSFSL